jgi:hypothetical protein
MLSNGTDRKEDSIIMARTHNPLAVSQIIKLNARDRKCPSVMM